MTAYQLLEANRGVHRTADNSDIPFDPSNRDYVEYLAWVNAGNTADPFVQDPAVVALAARTATFNADATRADLLARLSSATPVQLNSYVDANVVDLASARTLLKKILLVIAR